MKLCASLIDTRTPQFLAMNANGKIPLLALPEGQYLPESNAILAYLADASPLGGTERLARARVLQWMFFEQYSHEPNIATSRFIIQYLGNPPDRAPALQEKQVAGYQALDVMEQQLLRGDFICGKSFTIADIALFAYTHVADEGGFSLDDYPAIRSWIERIKTRDKFVAMRRG